MTRVTDLVDPYEVFWSKARSVGQLQDPSALLPEESATAARIEHEGHTEDLVIAAGALAAAFYLYRNYMGPRIKAAMAGKDGKPSTLAWVTGNIFNKFLARWVAITTPALISGYAQGVAEAQAGTIPDQYLADIANNYARQLGEHINAVSAEALMAGYQAQLNRKVPAARALEQVLMAYGVPPKTMNALISVWNSDDPKRLTTIPMESVRDQRARALVETELKNRGRQIGENETWSTKSQAKQIVWMYGMQSGVIPPTATRVWVTAHDEKVCKYCGPLHKTEAPLNEQFSTDMGKVWTPPLHVNCRCDVVLDYHVTEHMQGQLDELLASESRSVNKRFTGRLTLISKAYDKNEPRDEQGRWTAKPQKKAQAPKERPFAPAPVREHFVDPAVAAILRQISEHEEEVEQQADQEEAAQIGRTQLQRGGLKRVSLGRAGQLPRGLPRGARQIGREQVRRHQMARPQLQMPSKSQILRGMPEQLKRNIPGWIYNPERRGYALVEPYMRGSHGDVLLDENNDVWINPEEDDNARDGLSEQIGDYWEGLIGDMAQEFEYSGSPEQEYTDPTSGIEYYIDADAFTAAALHVVNNISDDQGDMIEMAGYDKRGKQVLKSFPAHVVAQHLNMYAKIQGEKPTVVVMMHHRHDQRASGEGAVTNPGEFTQAGPTLDEAESLSHQPYRILYVKPVEEK